MSRNYEVEQDLDNEFTDVTEEFGEEGSEFLSLEDYQAMGIDPLRPTDARPGSEEKVLMLSARYAAGLPLWHDEDCYDHGPQEMELMGANFHFSDVAPTQVEMEEDEEEVDA